MNVLGQGGNALAAFSLNVVFALDNISNDYFA
jgi:hypothetical protein